MGWTRPYTDSIPPFIITTVLPNATQNVFYSFQMQAISGLPPYTWSSTGGFPNGLSISSSGLISGTPTVSGSFNPNITITDLLLHVVSGPFSLTVIPANTLQISTTSPLPNATVNTAYSFNMTAIGGTPPYTWSITSDTPDTGNWLSIGAISGTLSGTPTTIETETVGIQVTDAAANAASGSFSLPVFALSQKVNWAPGHYLQFGENDSLAVRLNIINNVLPAQPGGGGIVGVVDVWRWGHLENGTSPGGYTFSDPNSVIAACKNKGLTYILDTASRNFGSASVDTSVFPQYIINNNQFYTRAASPSGLAVGAAIWNPTVMTFKTNLELAFVNQTAVQLGLPQNFMATYVTSANPTMMGWSSDESVIGQNLTVPDASHPYAVDKLVSAEIVQRWQVLRQQIPQLTVILYTNFLNNDLNGSPNMVTLFQNAASIGGILMSNGPDLDPSTAYGTYLTSTAPPSEQVLDGRIGGANAVNYAGPGWGVMGGVQTAEQAPVTFQQIFDAFDGHFQAQYQQWYESPTYNTAAGNPTQQATSLKTFLINNPVSHVAYPQNWPGAPQAPGATQVFNFPAGGFNSSNVNTSTNAGTIWVGGTNGGAGLSGNNLTMFTTTVGHTGGKAWYVTKVNIQSFTCDFTMTPPSGLVEPTFAASVIIGITFSIQNAGVNSNPNGNGGSVNGIVGLDIGGDANSRGYGSFWGQGDSGAPAFDTPMGNSVGLSFDMSGGYSGSSTMWNPGITLPNSINLLASGGPSAEFQPRDDLNPSGINFYTGNPVAVHLVYDGTLLTMTMKDTVNTSAQFRCSWPFNIPLVVGANTARIGFVAGKAPVNGATASKTWLINSWSFSQGYANRLNTPTFSLAPGTYTGTQSVTISAPVGSTVYHTTNGQDPTTASSTGTSVSITSTTQLKAIAVQNGFTDSLVASANYIIGTPVTTPNINFASPNFFTGASNLLSMPGVATISGANLQLIPTITNNDKVEYVGAAWYPQPMSIGSFSTTFTFQMQITAGGLGPHMGMTFCIQNQALPSDFRFYDALPLAFRGIGSTNISTPTTLTVSSVSGTNNNAPATTLVPGLFVTDSSGLIPAPGTTIISQLTNTQPGGASGGQGTYQLSAPVTGTGSGLNIYGIDGVQRWTTSGLLSLSNGNGFGYSGNTGSGPHDVIAGLPRSVAIKFDAGNNTTGLYTNGVDVNAGLNGVATGFNFTSGAHQFQTTLTYTGPDNTITPNTLKISIKDLNTNTTFNSTLSTSLNIPSIVGGSLALVGFTAGSYNGNLQQITNWTWSS